MPPVKSIQLMGCRVDDVTWTDLDQICRDYLNGDRGRQIVTINGEFVLEAQRHPAFRQTINDADLVIPDSTNVVWLSRLKGRPLRQRTPGNEFTLFLSKIAAETGASVYLLGGWGGVPAKAAEVLRRYYPDLKIAGSSEQDPADFDPTEIKKSGADIVFVAYAAPKQDLWIAQNKEKTGAKILVGVGGTFNMLAGTLPRAPQLIRALHLEWLWRLVLEPQRRWKRAWNAVVVFPLRAVFSN